MISQHPNDVPGHLTRGEVWSRISIALLLGVSLAVAKSNARREQQALGSSRTGWDAARRRQQQFAPTKKFKPGPFDHWTDEELWEKATTLLGGRGMAYDSGAWFDLDRAYSIANWNRSDSQTCYATKKHIERAVADIRLAKRIYDTGRINRFAKVKNLPAIDFDMLAHRVAEAITANDRVCAPYDGPTFP